MDILSVGEIVIDFLPGGPGVYIRKPGGAPANVAVAMSRLGRGAAFCGCAGDDDFGRFLLDTLRQNGVLPLLKLTSLRCLAASLRAYTVASAALPPEREQEPA